MSDGTSTTTGPYWQFSTSGACTTDPECDDGNICTDDDCNESNVCVHTNNAAACNDSNACTQSDVCENGVCLGANPVVCDDGIACTDDTCVTATGACQYTVKTCPSGWTCNATTGFCEGPPLPITAGTTWRYFKGTEEPSPGDLTYWTTIYYDDSDWLEGPGGLGFDYYAETAGTNGNGDYGPHIGTQLSDMRNCTPINPPLCNDPGYASVYMRTTFTVANPAAVTELELQDVRGRRLRGVPQRHRGRTHSG